MTEREHPSEARRPAAVLVLGALVTTAIDAALLVLALGGIRPLLAHPRAPVLIAVWAVAAIVLALLRPVRRHDPLTVRHDRAAMVALLILPLATPAVSAWGGRTGLWPLPGGDALRWAGVAIVAGGLALRIAAMARLGSRFSPLVAVQREHALETGGPYARIRHPGYLGAWLAALGAMLTFGSLAGAPLVAAFLALLWARAGREEALLAEHFGDDWRRYRARSGRLFPRLVGGG